MELPNSIARYAAIGAVAVAFVVIIVLIGSSLGGSDSGADGGGQPAVDKSQSKAKSSGGQERKFYVVKPGDCCLSQIAEKTGIDIEELEQLNPGLDPQAIHSGDRVKLR